MTRSSDLSAMPEPAMFLRHGLPSDNIEGRYRVVGWLGGGGMGDVYEVEHLRLGRRFALKVLRADLAREPALAERFDREARAVAALRSDYIVSIVDAGAMSDGRPFFVMERLQGQDLGQLLATLPVLPRCRAVNLAIDACLGLHVTHRAGLVHRDLKPENLFIARGESDRDRCKLLDFGVAKLAHQDQTHPGALVGTARYMAPEQVAQDGSVGPGADLFALGVLLYRCLSGVHPFDADSLERVLYKVMNEAPPRLDAASPHVPPELAELVERLLAKRPEQRLDNALTVARLLLPFAGVTRELPSPTVWAIEAATDDTVLGDRETPAEGAPAFQPEPAAKSTVKMASASTVEQPPQVHQRGRWAFAALALLATAMISALMAQRRAAAPVKESVASTTSAAASAIAVAPLPSAAPMHSEPAWAPPPQASADAQATSAVVMPSSARPAGRVPKPAAKSNENGARPPASWFDPRNPYGY